MLDSQASSNSHPNILIFMTDQQRGSTVLPGSGDKALTPRLDAFREEASTFSKFYTVSPHCCPSRASFFTGLYPSEHGIWNNVDVPNTLSLDLRPGTRSWSESLKAAGYELGFSGKWHVSKMQSPEDFGWKTLFCTTANDAEPKDAHEAREMALAAEHSKYEKGAIYREGDARGEGQVARPDWLQYLHYGETENPFQDEDVVEAGRKFVQEKGGKEASDPWCLYVGTLGPHDPYMVPQRFLAMYDAENLPELPESFYDDMMDKPSLYRRTRNRFDQLTEREHREAIRHYLAFCTYEDYLFGLLLDDLEETGQLDNTIVMYLSDHGDYMGEHGLWCKGLPSFESAYHVPCIIRDPRLKEGGTVEALANLTDMGATLLDLAGVERDFGMSGKSLAPWMRGEAVEGWRDALFCQSNGNETYGIQRIVTTKKWKYVYNGYDYDELYDLEEDPRETTNLLFAGRDERRLGQRADTLSEAPEEYREVLSEMVDRLWQFQKETNDEVWNGYVMTAFVPKGPAGVLG